jgi:hypothetical protein
MRVSLRNLSSRDDRATPQQRESRAGFVIVEVIVAMVLLAIAVTSLAGLVWSVSKSSIRTTGDAYKNGVLMHEVNRLEGLPYDSIPISSTWYSVSSGAYAHTRYVDVLEPAANIKTITIRIAPVNPTYKPDTVRFIRTRARTSKVLCVTCQ